MTRVVKLVISLAFAGLFLWLAFREVDFADFWEATKGMTFGWIAPYILLTLIAHYARAERWKLLLDKEQEGNRLTLFTSVMLGYLLNYAFPRLGELTRPVYVAQAENVSKSKMIGTIVLERVIDTFCMFALMIFVVVFMITDKDVLIAIFGTDITNTDSYVDIIITLSIYGAFAIMLLGVFYQLLRYLNDKSERVKSFFEKLKTAARTFIDGLFAIRKLDNWFLFIVYTVVIWASYILLTYTAFWMFDLADVYDLSVRDALVVTMIAAIGIIIPTPGGIGTYHWFTKQALFVLFAVPQAIGLAYATIAHAGNFLIILIVTPILLSADKYYSLKRNK